ncbi:MAG: hypothetical protein US76_02620 [Parcubacteria group bacterium GW2011_GWA2_38_13b]|nr:MAG: hypothetical protein US76_02620 [Parcubacteria group bacterium GW2011_GWA2_38_13b]
MEQFYEKLFNIDYKEYAGFLSATISDFFGSPAFVNSFWIFKIVMAVFSLLFFIFIVILIIKLKSAPSESSPRQKAQKAAVNKEELAKKWSIIAGKSKSLKTGDWKLAIIEADKFLDDLLKRLGYEGESMGDRLKKLDSKKIANIDQIWQAHKIRNDIVHHPEYEPSKGEIDFALGTYERALQDLSAD